MKVDQKLTVFSNYPKPLYHFSDNCSTALSVLFPVLRIQAFWPWWLHPWLSSGLRNISQRSIFCHSHGSSSTPLLQFYGSVLFCQILFNILGCTDIHEIQHPFNRRLIAERPTLLSIFVLLLLGLFGCISNPNLIQQKTILMNYSAQFKFSQTIYISYRKTYAEFSVPQIQCFRAFFFILALYNIL